MELLKGLANYAIILSTWALTISDWWIARINFTLLLRAVNTAFRIRVYPHKGWPLKLILVASELLLLITIC